MQQDSSEGSAISAAWAAWAAWAASAASADHEWNSLFFPGFNDVTSGAAFYAVRAASALLALGVVAMMTRRRPERLPESAPVEEEMP